MVGSFDPEIMKFLQSSELEYDNIHMPSLNSPYIDRKILQFCGDEPLLKQILEDIHLSSKIKRSEILFNKFPHTLHTHEQFEAGIYNIEEQEMSVESIYKYGLSHQTAKWVFANFQNYLNGLTSLQINYNSMKKLMQDLMPLSHQVASNGLQYLSETIGLDQKYIQDFVNPVISSTYFQNVNSVAIFFKLLPLYCNNLDFIWKGKKIPTMNRKKKSKILIFDQRLFAAKILQKLQESRAFKQIRLIDAHKISYQQNHEHTITMNIGDSQIQEGVILEPDILFILEDLKEDAQKKIFYFRTIIDGIIPKDQQNQEVFTMYFQNSPVLSVTRLCAKDCKNFKNSVYLLISKGRLMEKDLTMFTQYRLISSKKYWNPRSHIQSSSRKFIQSPNIYHVIDTQLISDSYEFKLIVFRNLANTIKSLINSPFSSRNKQSSTKKKQ